eukprot:1176238-Prorocentrum_minimum.AAC.3
MPSQLFTNLSENWPRPPGNPWGENAVRTNSSRIIFQQASTRDAPSPGAAWRACARRFRTQKCIYRSNVLLSSTRYGRAFPAQPGMLGCANLPPLSRKIKINQSTSTAQTIAQTQTQYHPTRHSAPKQTKRDKNADPCTSLESRLSSAVASTHSIPPGSAPRGIYASITAGSWAQISSYVVYASVSLTV